MSEPTSATSAERIAANLAEVDVAPARMAILMLTPVGYGMSRDEADAYARAAIGAYLSRAVITALQQIADGTFGNPPNN